MATAKRYGPYKGSGQNDGRKIYVYRKADGSTTSKNAARADKETAIGRKLPKSQHVAHKSGTVKGGQNSTSPSTTRVESASKNIGDGNKTRAGVKKSPDNPKKSARPKTYSTMPKKKKG
jgi:hypothetical protein